MRDEVNKVFGGEESRLNTVVYHEDGKVFDLYDYGIVTRDFIVSSPSYSRDFAYIEGRRGVIEEDLQTEPRDITIAFWMKATDNLGEFVDLRDFVFNVFGTGKPVHVIDTRRPEKRWKVILESPFQIEQERSYGFFEVSLYAIEGVSESVNVVEREFYETEFTFRNEGNTSIDMRNVLEAEVIVRGSGSELIIENETTGDIWEYEKPFDESDEIMLKGVSSFKNGESIFIDTNKRILSFAPGANKMSIRGTSGDIEVIFKTRWYFL